MNWIELRQKPGALFNNGIGLDLVYSFLCIYLCKGDKKGFCSVKN